MHIYMHIYYKQTFQNDQGRTPLLVSANNFSATNEADYAVTVAWEM